ncbi:EAL domain-containing protein [Aurantiacibacter sp. MUD11]|uniref:putative bifunctional diguanylate cyclase/phosphodiesterase n=1 Tax=Aurantiacibacter sp. MUD11 TaxID=3003265 RepID=UPI0022AAEC17|nr:EAL domain-containing protein [Aurantiacibacter sp. MUD11]WAT17986.1 EAL domain-containing protein [Aurantiacibacter sp. MUD11]
MVGRIASVETLAEDVRQRLSGTLHVQPISLAIGCACGILTAWACAAITRSFVVAAVAVGITLFAVVRVAISAWLNRDPEGRANSWFHEIYPLLTFFYAALTGMLAALMLLADAPAGAQLIAVSYMMAYCSVTSVRTAGRPMVALGQMAVSLLPVGVACLIIGTLPALVLAVTLPCYAVGMTTMSLTVFRNLTHQLEAADTRLRHAEELRMQARTDLVTGLINRSGFSVAFEPLAAALPEGRKLALLWLDLHRFKVLNDTMGHTAGDKVLAEVAKRLDEVAPTGSVLSRFAGDEFLLATTVASRAEAEELTHAVSATVGRPVRLNGERVESGAYIGVALLPDDAPNTEKLMQAADLALFHAKVLGPHKVCFFDNSMTHELARKKEIEDELRAAIQKDELAIFFQPIIDLENGRIRSFEALVRWYHPEKGELFPDEFIPVAEDTGLIITLGNWITAQAARAASTWPEDVTLAVNLSPVQIKAPGAALGILAALKEARLDPSRLELEVTESLFVEDDENTTEFMSQLAREGVRFALDDFGTGYSSLHYINRYPFRTIKVDRSFISGPQTGKRSDAIIRAVAEMGTTLDMEIVAEGLETIEQVQAVRTAGCSLGQGYYFSRAVPDYLAALLLTQEAQRMAEQDNQPLSRLAV